MDCPQAKEIVQAYVDGELDLVNTLDIERHLRDCRPCAASHQNLMALRTTIRDGSLYHRAPAMLEMKIRSQIREARKETLTGGVSSRQMPSATWGARWGAVAALLIVAATLAISLHFARPSADSQLAYEVTSSHIRSMMLDDRKWDVKSTDQHTVKPWFDGKIDFAPPVHDFQQDGFALEGGRLDYLAGRPVAALVYHHEKHYANLFIWPATDAADHGPAAAQNNGYNLVHWTSGGMNFWLISDMSSDTLQRFAGIIRAADGPATRP